MREGSFNAIALILLIPGVALLLWCVRDFLVIGKGTLAPWDPPRGLVFSGAYRFSRNPMYVGVSLILLGWAMAFRSSGLLLYALIVMLAFHLRVVFGEEPWLARTHQRTWNEYRLASAAMDIPKPARDGVLVGGAVVLLALAGLMTRPTQTPKRRASFRRQERWWTSVGNGCTWCASAVRIRWNRW